MGYLEDVIAATEKTRARTRKAEGSASLVAAIAMQKAQAAQASTMANMASSPLPRTPRRAAPSPVVSKGSGPHTAGDGHNHGSGGNQTVGEANELWRRLQNMIKDRPTIKPGARSRSYAEQVALWNKYKAGKGAMAARPGTSKHGNGRANDLKYSNDQDREWALKNAGKYGLAFPLYNPKLGRGRDESWHVELAR